ncbi:MAG: hypothetical protein R3A46_09780 [Thermomicrobiales bacterium]
MIAASCRVEVRHPHPGVGVSTDEVLERIDEILSRHEGARATGSSTGPNPTPASRTTNWSGSSSATPKAGESGHCPRSASQDRLPALALPRHPGLRLRPTPYAMGAPDEHVLIDDLLATVQVHTLSAFDYLSS